MTGKPLDALPAWVRYIRKELPWDRQEDNRLRILMILAMLLAFILMLLIQNTVVPKRDRAEAEKIPERLAKLLLERKPEPPPPPPPEEKKEEPKPEEPKPEAADDEVKKARDKAEKAMAEAKQELQALQDLSSAFDFGDMQPLTKAGAQSTTGMQRDLITSRSGKGSGGVNIGTASSGGGGEGIAGGGKLAAASGSKVESSIAEGPTGPTRKTAGGKLVRTEEEVRRIMERNNGALQAIYQRALRSNPALKGAVVLRLVIAPDGSVTTCDLVSSELGDPETERKLLARIRAINFGAIEGVAPWDDKYTLNFFPS